MIKRMHRPLFWLSLAAAVLLLAACDVSLAADVTPPPDYKAPEQAQPAALETVFPLVPPDPTVGAAIYAEKCEPCHGVTGRGDGSQSANLPNLPPSIGAPELSRQKRPVDWFSIVTNGNLQKMMPGFGSSLDDRQRWDLVSYVYSLSMTPASLEQGKGIYTEQCASCHGDRGQGGTAGAPDWTQPERLARLSAAELGDVVLNGKGDMPAYQGKLDENQVWAAVDYIRTLTFAAPAPAPVAAAQATPAAAGTAQPGTEATAPAVTQVNITGKLTNASGGAIPAGLTVKLLGFDQMQQAFEKDAPVAADGSFSFEQVEANPDRVFMATTEVNGFPYNSDPLHARDFENGSAALNIIFYDTTTDASALVAERMHVFFDFSDPGIVKVGELFILSNPTAKLVVSAGEGKPVLSFELPEGASNLQFQDGEMGNRFVQTPKGFGDTAPVPPGSGSTQVLFAYDLPYDRKITVNLVPPVPVMAAVIISPAGNVKTTGDQLTDAGIKTMEDVQVHLYSASNIEAGSSLKVTLSGKPGGSGSFFEQNQLASILIGLAVLLVVAGLILIWYMRRRVPAVAEGVGDVESEEIETPDEIVDAIVALDDQYQAGDLPKDAYDERRAALKDQLRRARDNQLKGS